MSRYNEQHATTMLNALQGTETLERFKQQVRADALDDLVRMVSVYYTMQERAGYYSDTNNMIKQRIADFAEKLKGQNNG